MFTKIEKKTWKHSNFFLTINTNQRYTNDDPNLQSDTEIFEQIINNMLNNLDQYIKFPNGDDWQTADINDVDVDYVIEKGTKKNCLHAHAVIKIKHNTKVQIDFPKIQRSIADELGMQNIYVNGRLIKNSGADNIQDYLLKYTNE